MENVRQEVRTHVTLSTARGKRILIYFARQRAAKHPYMLGSLSRTRRTSRKCFAGPCS